MKIFQRHLLLLFLMLLLLPKADCQTLLVKEKDETIEDFVERISMDDTTANAELTHNIITTDIWDSLGKVILFFEEKDFYDTLETNSGGDQTIYDRETIIAYSLITNDNKHYKRLPIDTLFLEGTELPEIRAVFFANCDGDRDKELFILWRSEYIHHQQAGWIYRTYVYDPLGKHLNFWNKLKDIGSWFDYANVGPIDGGENTDVKLKEGKVIPKSEQFDSAEKIKDKLKTMGY